MTEEQEWWREAEGAGAVDGEEEGSDITLKDLRDPGLYPRFAHFHANTRSGFLPFAAGKLNVLTSAFACLMGFGKSPSQSFLREYVDNVKHARLVFVDSGAISTMTAVERGRGTRDDVLAWTARQKDVVKVAWTLHEAGSPAGVVAAMDMPAYEGLLRSCDLDVAEAQRITFDNTVELRGLELPPDWKPVYMAQGGTEEEYVRFVDQLAELGCIDDVREGRAWLGVGGTRDLRPPALYTIYEAIRRRLGPEGHVHALGISRKKAVAHMASRHWIQSSDSSSAMQEIVYNRGRYAITGPRPQWLTEALWAAAMLYLDAELAHVIREADRRGAPIEQGVLFQTEGMV